MSWGPCYAAHISSSTLLLDQQSQLAELSSIEAAWNMNKFAHEARKQRLVDVCVVALSEAGKLLRDANTNKRNPDNLNAEFCGFDVWQCLARFLGHFFLCFDAGE